MDARSFELNLAHFFELNHQIIRRYHAAKALGYTEIPVVVETFHSEEAMIERLLRENENRGKTPEQQIREGMCWEPIEEEKARRRMNTGGKLTCAYGKFSRPAKWQCP